MMRKQIIFSCSALLSLTLLVSSLPVSFMQVTHAQETEIALNDEVTIIKEKLSDLQPINREQLKEIPDDKLIAYYHEALAKPELVDEEAMWRAVYDAIVQNFPTIALVKGEDYDAYVCVIDALTQATNWSVADLRKVDGVTLLKEYRALMQANANDVTATVQAIMPFVEKEMQDYDERQKESDAAEPEEPSEELPDEVNEEVISEEIPGDGAIDESVSEVNPEQDPGAESTESSVSSEESASVPAIDIEQVRQGLIEVTPITQDQAAALTPKILEPYLTEVPQTQEDYESLYNLLVTEHADIFRGQLDEIKNQLFNTYQLNPNSLTALVSDEQLLWLNKEVSTDVLAPNYEQLVKTLVEVYQVTQDTDTTLRYTIKEIRNLLIRNTPITQEQLNGITDDEIKSLLPEQADELDSTKLFNDLLINYTDIFAAEITYLIDALTVTNKLLDPASLQANVTSEALLWAEYQVWLEDSQENIPRLAQVLVDNYQVTPITIEESTSSESESAVESSQEVSSSDVNASSEISSEVVVSSDVSVSSSSESVALPESQSTPESVASSDESQESTITPAEIVTKNKWRESLINETPMTQNQLDTFTDEELVATSEKILEPVAFDLFFNQLVQDYPDRFQAEVSRMKEALAANYIDTNVLSTMLSDVDLLWEEFDVYVSEGKEDFAALATRLLDLYGDAIENKAARLAVTKEKLLKETPMTQEQLNQFTDETLMAYIEMLGTNEGMVDLYNKISQDYPDVFKSQADILRESLVREGHVSEDSLKQVNNNTLLWQAYQVVNQSTEVTTIQNVNITVLTNYLVEQNIVTQVVSSETQSSQSQASQSQSSESSSIKASTRAGIEANQGTERASSKNTELTPGANASLPKLSSESSSSISSSSSAQIKKKDDLPGTGERTNWLYAMSGVILIVAAMSILVIGRNKGNNK